MLEKMRWGYVVGSGETQGEESVVEISWVHWVGSEELWVDWVRRAVVSALDGGVEGVVQVG